MIEQKVPVVILSYLGQSKIYHTVHEIKTAKAEFFKCFVTNKNDITTSIKSFWVISHNFIWVGQFWSVCRNWYWRVIHPQHSKNDLLGGIRRYSDTKRIKHQYFKTEFTNTWAKPPIRVIPNWPKKKASYFQRWQ